MNILIESAQMKQCDRNTIEYFGIPSLVLMERAALGVAEEIERCMEHRSFQGEALLVCGVGNNGGDGLAAARLLWQRGWNVTVVMPPEFGKLSAEAKIQMDILKKYQIPIADSIPGKKFDVIVDALFGIGLTREVTGIYQKFIVKMNEMEGLKVAVDIPSGIHGDTGAVMGTGFYADLTVTFAFAKAGLLLFPGAEYAKRVVVKDIGIDRHSFLENIPGMYYLTKEDLLQIPSRKVRSNKGSYGRTLVVAGQKNMAGAAFLCAKAAYLTGTGLVKVMTAEENRIILQQLLPEAILDTYNFPDTAKGLAESLGWASAIAIGPGIGGGDVSLLVKIILKNAKVPLILDADGLNIVAEHLEWLKEAKTTVIVTPHLGEMARLTKTEVSVIREKLVETARAFAEKYHVICILKDARTITALPDGKVWVNTSGNNGMATAGSGDVLTGILAGLAAQGMKPELAAPVGVYLHGLAGDRGANEIGVYGLMAQDILEGIPIVLKEISKEGKQK
ncbi:MAG: NAD(P)H-hydrate dehydratase [Lachnospiraceae bacterium]|nr:NAD(P)H-hydrate dehydratase [Lachnospiraceae bacterium]